MRHSGDSVMSQTRQPRGILRARRGGATTAGLILGWSWVELVLFLSPNSRAGLLGCHRESEARGVDGNVDDSWGPAATTAISKRQACKLLLDVVLNIFSGISEKVHYRRIVENSCFTG